jgi:uncharacterized membrane protein required for colicin V production
MIIDIVVALVLLVALFVGYQRGVIQPLMAEIFFFGTLLVVFRFHDQYTTEMEKIVHLNAVLSVFVAIILAIVMGAIGGAIGGAFHRIESIRGIDGLLGVFVHVAVTLVVVYLAISALVVLDNAFVPTLNAVSLTAAQVTQLESWIESNPITAAMVSKDDLKALKDAAASASGAHLDSVQGIHQLQQIYTGFLEPQLHGSKTVPIILSIGSHLPFIGHVGPSDLHAAPTPAPSPSPSPTVSPKHSPTPKVTPKKSP